jgi:hypothetical protein
MRTQHAKWCVARCPSHLTQRDRTGLCDKPRDSGCVAATPVPVSQPAAGAGAGSSAANATVPDANATATSNATASVAAPASAVAPAAAAVPSAVAALPATPAAPGTPAAAPGAAPATGAVLSPEALKEARIATSQLIHALSDPSAYNVPPLCGSSPDTCKRLDCIIHPTCKAILGI